MSSNMIARLDAWQKEERAKAGWFTVTIGEHAETEWIDMSGSPRQPRTHLLCDELQYGGAGLLRLRRVLGLI